MAASGALLPWFASQQPPAEISALVLPWDILVSDNEKAGPRIRGGQMVGIGTTAAYRKGKENVHLAARAFWRGRPLIEGDCLVYCRAYFPALVRKRDQGNMRKLILDALAGAIYLDDSQVRIETWERCGIDVKHPRMEVFITPEHG